MPMSNKNRAALLAQRTRIAEREAVEFMECLSFAREALSEKVEDDYFESVIHTLWYGLRGDIPEAW